MISLPVLTCLLMSQPLASAGATEVARIPWPGVGLSHEVRVDEQLRSDGVVVRTLRVADSKGNELHRLSTPDGFLSAFVVRDDAECLVTIWTTGSGYRVRVLRGVGGKFDLAFESGYRGVPIIVPSRSKCPDFIEYTEGGSRDVVWDGSGYVRRAGAQGLLGATGVGSERVASQLRLVSDPQVGELFAGRRWPECAALLASGLEPVAEGKYQQPDEAHLRYVARVRLLRLILRADQALPVERSSSIHRGLFPEGGVPAFWLWMSRDTYVFPSVEDQTKLIAQWRSAAAAARPAAVDEGLDLNDWWF